MNTAPPPLVKPFRLPLAAWLAWGAYAVLMIVLFLTRKTPATAFELGRLSGGIVASLILPTLVAWIAWRAGRRSPVAGATGFFAVFGLMLIGELTQLARRTRASVAMHELSAEQHKLQEEQRRALEKGGRFDDAKAEELARRTAEQIGKVAQASSGRDRDAAAATKAYLDRLLATKKRYDTALAEIRADTFWDLSTYESLVALGKRREAVQAFARANEELSGLQDRSGSGLRLELERHGLPAEFVQSALASYKTSTGSRIDAIVGIRESDAAFAGTMRSFLDLVEANFGKWKPAENDNLVFQDSEAAKRYTELISEAQTLATKQTELQKQLVAPREGR